MNQTCFCVSMRAVFTRQLYMGAFTRCCVKAAFLGILLESERNRVRVLERERGESAGGESGERGGGGGREGATERERRPSLGANSPSRHCRERERGLNVESLRWSEAGRCALRQPAVVRAGGVGHPGTCRYGRSGTRAQAVLLW